MASFLEISRLTVAFPRAPEAVLDDVELRIEKGEYVAVIGHSGCGKSTMLNVVAGLLPATLGGVLLEGREVSGSTPPSVAGSSPATTFSMVDLPQPLWPITAT